MRRRSDILRMSTTGLSSVALLSSASLAALMLGVVPLRADDACALSGGVLTCTGDQSDGIRRLEGSTRFDTLVVNSLDRDIAPAEYSGIRIDWDDPIAAEVDTGSFAIRAGGQGASGIVLNNYGTGGASLDFTGTVVSSKGAGIKVLAPGDVSYTGTGSVSSDGTGITVKSESNGSASLDHTGAITSQTGSGVLVTGSDDVFVKTRGVIQADDNAIFAKSYGNDQSTVTVDHAQGSLTSYSGYGIYALSAFDGVTVTVVGDISSMADGIYAKAAGVAGDAIISSTGTIISDAGLGIYALSAYGKTSVTNRGNVTSFYSGIYAKADSSADAIIDSEGDVLSETESGLVAISANGNAKIDSTGAVTAALDGLYARANGDVTIDTNGAIFSTNGRGIDAESGNGGVVVTSVGAIESELEAIRIKTGSLDTTELASVNSSGALTSRADRAIEVISSHQAIDIVSRGAINAKLEGIHATAGGETATISIDTIGAITSSNDAGIFANAAQGGITIVSDGAIEVRKAGIYAITGSDTAKVEIDSDGDITSLDDVGIFAKSARGSVDVQSEGMIAAKKSGIHAESGGDDDAEVTVTNIGNITSSDAYGIFATAARLKVSVDNTGEIVAKKDGIRAISTGGSVEVDQTGDISVTEGAGIYAYNTGDTVSVIMDGDITGGAYGIFGMNEVTDVSITFKADGTISGASQAGVYLYGITTTSFDNYGTIDGGEGVVVETDGWATNTVNNYGTMIGDFDMVKGLTNRLNNMSTGLMELGTTVTLNSAGILTNAGTVAPGGNGVITTTVLTGNFVQTGTGLMNMDVDFLTNDSDLIDVSGTASLAGRLGIVVADVGDLVPMTFTLLTSQSYGTPDLDFEHNLVLTNIALDADVLFEGGTDVRVRVNGLDFGGGPDTSGFNTKITDALTSSFQQGAPDLAPLFTALVNIQDVEEYAEAIEQLSPEITSQSNGGTPSSVPGFADRLLSCRVQDGAYAFNAEGECVWVSSSATRFDRDATADSLSYRQTAMALSAGAQKAFSPEIRIGGAVGYVHSSGANSGGSTARSDRLQAGVVVKYDREATLLAAGLTAGIGATDTTRLVTIGNLSETLEGESTNGFVAARLHAAHTFASKTAYLRPLVDLDLIGTSYGGVVETGGSSALAIDASTHLTAILAPAVEIGGEFDVGMGAVARPFVRGGVSYSSNPDIVTTARFAAGSPDSFTTTSSSDALLGKLSVGVDFVSENNASMRFYYDGAYGETTRQHSVGMKASVAF
ncbi:MAG: autotransporter domain-containing protein [Devosia sp.]